MLFYSFKINKSSKKHLRYLKSCVIRWWWCQVQCINAAFFPSKPWYILIARLLPVTIQWVNHPRAHIHTLWCRPFLVFIRVPLLSLVWILIMSFYWNVICETGGRPVVIYTSIFWAVPISAHYPSYVGDTQVSLRRESLVPLYLPISGSIAHLLWLMCISKHLVILHIELLPR